ncbi:hypothetical protein EDD11_002750 [Mortierella claussenii]|nr:hypothetical protein EDD11_002750 [Mortierella claussenii]
MFKHVYPAWHKPAQKILFVIAAILCITLPALYGSSRKPRRISAQTMGAIFGLYFGLWLLFSVLVRFLVPSPVVESVLPSYNPTPIPEPVYLHSPSRADAVPTSPAIRLHPSFASPRVESGVGAEAATGVKATIAARGARFAEDVDDSVSRDKRLTESSSTPTTRHGNNVTFQTRPLFYAADSNRSEAAYPTFAAYRQSQHGNFEQFAHRLKRAFATSQQQQREQVQQQQLTVEQESLEQQQQKQQSQQMQHVDSDERIDLQFLVPGSTATISNNGGHLELNASSTSLASSDNRSRPTSSGSMLADLAERIRNTPIFTRSPSLFPARSSTDPEGAVNNCSRPSLLSRLSIGGGSSANVSVIGATDATRAQSQQQQQQQQRKSTAETGYNQDDIGPILLSEAVPVVGEDEKQTEKAPELHRRSMDNASVASL